MVRPTMMSTNPAAPTLTFTICPISRMRSQSAPMSYCDAEHLQHGSGAM